jgi:RNA polymerase sigma-70 factor (ECF subfamily)
LLEHLRGAGAEDQAWGQLVDLYSPLLRAWFHREGLAEADSDDLSQEVLAVVCAELPRFVHNGRTGAFRLWLRRIAVNRLRAFRRARRRQPGTGDDEFQARLDQWENPDSPLSRQWDVEHDRHVSRQLLDRIRAEFQPATWAAFAGVMFEGQMPAEVAHRLGVSVNAVLLAKSRILGRLREAAKGILD